ncbi:hypothetical protein CBR_g36478 [Chara braunii]|uniref:RING-CH-type domain-containing protein n=1 Tax=Chara braunii TaxID=69332 RepID=A0A388LL51_CHABU|nr:hypothetical protein CBR_g36478 [Chara braunii]|eukprot:GBG82952.1 hypothetical protein CBR_g36478 [Chara braunii]
MSAPSLIGKKRKTEESECEKLSSRLSSRDPSPMAGELFPDDGFRICRICLEPSACPSPCAAEEGKGSHPPTRHQQHPHQQASQLLQSSAAHQASNEDQLVSPCGCTGTQAYVHLKCLRRWQMAVMSSRHPGANYAPALICSVCTKRFSFAPPKPALAMRLSGILDCYAREVAALIIFLGLVIGGGEVVSPLQRRSCSQCLNPYSPSLIWIIPCRMLKFCFPSK